MNFAIVSVLVILAIYVASMWTLTRLNDKMAAARRETNASMDRLTTQLVEMNQHLRALCGHPSPQPPE